MRSLREASDRKAGLAVVGTAASGLQFGRLHVSPLTITLACLLTICATLVAGLWPFCSPRNQAAWTQDGNGIRFDKHGTALSTGTLSIPDLPACSVEIWVRPSEVWKKGSILTFYNHQTDRQFTMEQDFTDLVLRAGDARRDHYRQRQLLVEDVFRKKQAFITVTSDGQNTSVYIDGRLAATGPKLRLSGKDLAGQMIVANAPLRDHSWPGEVKGLAVYASHLEPASIEEHYRSLTQKGEPLVNKSEVPVAVYVFGEHGGNVIHNAVGSGSDLEIPKHFVVVRQLLFEPPVTEFYAEGSYLKNAAINVAGFIPLGFILAVYFIELRRMRRAGLVTVLVAASVSIAIEYFQWYLPTRYSGVTDIITNTLGAWFGVLLYAAAKRLACRCWPEYRGVQASY